MTDEEIVKRAKDAEKRTGFGELVHSPVSRGVNSAYGIGFIEGMVEYRNSLQEEPVSEDFEEAAHQYYKPNETFMDGFKKGAKWQKEKMMRSVIASQECKYVRVFHRLIGGSWNLTCPTDKLGLSSDDKLKVCIIKEN